MWIVTSRMSDKENDWATDWNDDLYTVAADLGISKNHIKFMDMINKYKFFEDKDFIWHLDDDWTEVRLINKHTKTRCITHIGSGNWIHKCNKLFNKYENENFIN